MSDQELNNIAEEDVQLDEFKADHTDVQGKGAEVPEPVSKGSAKRAADKDQGDKKPAKLPGTRLGMINAMMNTMAGMNKSSLQSMYDKMVDNSAKNMASIKSKAMKEDIDELFDGQEGLSEDFIDKASTLFEAAVGARLEEERVRLEEEYAAKYEVDISEAKEEMNAKADEYLSYVAEEWMKENEVAIESGFRTEIAESFMEGLKTLFAEHYIDVPDEKLDVVDDLNKKSEDLEAKLEEEMVKSMELSKELEESKKNQIFAAMSEDLTVAQREKFTALSSGISYDSLEEFEEKLGVVYENYFAEKKTVTEDNSYDEEIETDNDEPTTVDPTVARYLDAISRTTKK
ncbi:MAG: hypothetical protein VW580_01390 [Flavobacteriaceae bacterium]